MYAINDELPWPESLFWERLDFEGSFRERSIKSCFYYHYVIIIIIFKFSTRDTAPPGSPFLSLSLDNTHKSKHERVERYREFSNLQFDIEDTRRQFCWGALSTLERLEKKKTNKNTKKKKSSCVVFLLRTSWHTHSDTHTATCTYKKIATSIFFYS